MLNHVVLGLGLSLLLPALYGPTAYADGGPEEEIEELTQTILKSGESADLLRQRAIEYNVIGKNSEALKDLERASELAPLSAATALELSKTWIQLNKNAEALDQVTGALKRVEDSPEKTLLHLVRAELQRAKGEHTKALEEAQKAVNSHAITVDGFLLRSQLQRKLKLVKERIEGLEQAIKATGSFLLKEELVDAWIENGMLQPALDVVQEELQASRLKSRWLLRRASIHLKKGAVADATSDVDAALKELNLRINSASPEPQLLALRGLAGAYQARAEDAKKDLESARDKGFVEDWVLELIKADGKLPDTLAPKK